MAGATEVSITETGVTGESPHVGDALPELAGAAADLIAAAGRMAAAADRIPGDEKSSASQIVAVALGAVARRLGAEFEVMPDKPETVHNATSHTNGHGAPGVTSPEVIPTTNHTAGSGSSVLATPASVKGILTDGESDGGDVASTNGASAATVIGPTPDIDGPRPVKSDGEAPPADDFAAVEDDNELGADSPSDLGGVSTETGIEAAGAGKVSDADVAEHAAGKGGVETETEGPTIFSAEELNDMGVGGLTTVASGLGIDLDTFTRNLGSLRMTIYLAQRPGQLFELSMIRCKINMNSHDVRQRVSATQRAIRNTPNFPFELIDNGITTTGRAIGLRPWPSTVTDAGVVTDSPEAGSTSKPETDRITALTTWGLSLISGDKMSVVYNGKEIVPSDKRAAMGVLLQLSQAIGARISAGDLAKSLKNLLGGEDESQTHKNLLRVLDYLRVSFENHGIAPYLVVEMHGENDGAHPETYVSLLVELPEDKGQTGATVEDGTEVPSGGGSEPEAVDDGVLECVLDGETWRLRIGGEDASLRGAPAIVASVLLDGKISFERLVQKVRDMDRRHDTTSVGTAVGKLRRFLEGLGMGDRLTDELIDPHDDDPYDVGDRMLSLS